MTAGVLDPLIHVPARLRIVATLAALPDGDTRRRRLPEHRKNRERGRLAHLGRA